MNRIAIISDIHGNMPALRAVLEDINRFDADQTYCLGDLTDGAPWHNEIIDLIRHLNIPTIMGNHDERIAFDHPVLPLSKHTKEEQQARLEAICYTKNTITSVNKDFLRNLPGFISFKIGTSQIFLSHGSPRSVDEYIYENHDEADLISMLNGQQADLLVVGHTHLPFIRILKNKKLVVNAGSVGRSREVSRQAAYIQILIHKNLNSDIDELEVRIKRMDYPIEETVKGIKESEVPDFYADFLSLSAVK